MKETIRNVPAVVETQPTMPMPMSMSMSVDSAVEAFKQFQELRTKLGDLTDFVSIRGKEHPKKSWANKLARFFGISIEILEDRWDGEGKDRSCLITVRATGSNSMRRDATGACSFSEKRGTMATVHNVRAHASTRAKTPAILELVGGGEVSAEELQDSDLEAQEQPVSIRTPEPTQTTKNGNGKGNLDKARKATFALATAKGLMGKFTDEAFKRYCYKTFEIESRKDMSIEQYRTLYGTLRDDAEIVDKIKLTGKRIEVETLIEDLMNEHQEIHAKEIINRLAGDVEKFNNADMQTMEGWIDILNKLQDEGSLMEFIQREPPF